MIRFFIQLSLSLTIVSFSSALALASCSSDQALEEAKFEVHSSSDFEDLSKSILKSFSKSRDNFVYDTAGQMRAKQAEHGYQTLKLISFDDLTTPHSSKYGDIVFVFSIKNTRHMVQMIDSSQIDQAPKDSQLVEVR